MIPCILPWINFGTNNSGRTRVCGYSDPERQWETINSEDEYNSWYNKLENSTIDEQWNSLYFREIRKSFLNGEWPENCKRCKHVEYSHGTSKRMHENHIWFEKYNHLIEVTSEDGTVNYSPPHIDIRTGTVCNFKCIHCSPASSTKWIEDIDLITQYGFNYENVDNSWVVNDSKFWDNLDISQIKRYNFLGGESFYNKKHNEFIKKLNQTKYASDVEIMYVSNGSLLTDEKINDLINFKQVKLRLSVDIYGHPGEYFRHGLNWDQWVEKCKYIENFSSKHKNFDVAFQWTCSNLSLFYLIDTYDCLRKLFPNIRFIFSNHVTEPVFLSPQNLPQKLKTKLQRDIENYSFSEYNKNDYLFYVNYMMQQNTWSEYGITLIEYLNDLDKARNIKWKDSFKEFYENMV